MKLTAPKLLDPGAGEGLQDAGYFLLHCTNYCEHQLLRVKILRVISLTNTQTDHNRVPAFLAHIFPWPIRYTRYPYRGRCRFND